jgi:hypothetical protein
MGVFVKNPRLRQFSEFMKKNSLRKSSGICHRNCGPGPWLSAHRSMDPSLNVDSSTLDGRTRLECEGVCFPGRRK